MSGEHPPFTIWHPEIEREERLVFALDVPSAAEALELVDQLGDAVRFYKVGWELFMGGEYFQLIEKLVQREKKVFADLKVIDIPETVERAVRNLKNKHGMYLTLFAQYPSVLDAAVRAKNGIRILAVTTALTSKTRDEMVEWGDLPPDREISELVLLQARRTAAVKCDGFVCSALEVPAIRREFGSELLIFSPGIRPAGKNVFEDDQRRTATPEQAFINGADYIIVGRPIRESMNKRHAAMEIQETIARCFPRDGD